MSEYVSYSAVNQIISAIRAFAENCETEEACDEMRNRINALDRVSVDSIDLRLASLARAIIETAKKETRAEFKEEISSVRNDIWAVAESR